jgi:hypothetical protein
MIYISKGIAGKGSTTELVQVVRGSNEVHLSDKEATLWLRGRFSFASANMPEEERALRHLVRMGLAEAEPEDTKDARYWILARCVCCPTKGAKRSFGLAAGEKKLLFWLVHAGIRLSTAELVYLREHKIEAVPGLLYPGNRQALVETIYTAGTIADNLLENRMAAAGCRDSVVRDILSLLGKKKLLIL